MSEYEVIPQAAIDYLIANPNSGAQFDSFFGKGRAAEVFANQYPVPEPEEAEDEDWTFAGEAWRMIAGGVRDAAQETLNFGDWVADGVADALVGDGKELFWTGNGFEILDIEEARTREDIPAWQRTLAGSEQLVGDGGFIDLPEVEDNKTIVGGVGRGITQFAVGFVGAGKLTRLRGLKGAFVNGAIADAVVFDPNDPNVMGMLESFGFDTGAVGDALATNPDDPEYINRLRNVAEGVALGGIIEAIGWGVKAARAAKAGDTAGSRKFTEAQEAALKELDDAIAVEGKAAIDDARTTLDLSKTLFDELEVAPAAKEAEARPTDADGQLRMDLGDTPTPSGVVDNSKVPNVIRMTPERIEKIRLQTALASGAPAAAKTAKLSFKSLTTVTDFKDVIDDIAGVQAVMADDFAKIKGGDVQRWATVKAQAAAKLRQMAEMTGEDPKALMKRFMSADMGDVTKIAAEIHARSRYILTVEKELKEMATTISDALNGKPYSLDKFPGIKDLDHLRLAFQQRREVATNLLAGQDALRSNVARAMNAMKIAVKGDEKLQNLLRNDASVWTDIDSVAKAVADPANAGKPAVKVINDALGKLHGYMNDINTFRINALLSGPGTHQVNFISNAIQSFLIPLEQAIGGATAGDRRMMTHAVRQLQGSFAGLWDAVGTALKAGWWNDAVLDAQSLKIEDAAVTQGGKTLLGKVVRLPSRALMTMDEFFKQSQYRGVVFADANHLAKEKKLTGAARTDFIKQYLKESYTDTGAAVRGDALLQARRATFTEPLEPGVAAMIQTMAIKSPIIRFVVPFIRTPVNILSQTFQHAPLVGMASKRFRADIEAGGARAAQARGKQLVGLGLVALAGFQAAQGRITGSGPSDPRIRSVWLKNNKPYSFKIVNEDGSITWISYARLEPLSNVFSIAADVVEIMNDEYNESEKTDLIRALTMSVMENTVNKTFTQGIYDAMTAFNGEPHAQQRAINNFIASFTPNIINQTNGDELLRETRTLTDMVLAKTHLYNQVDPKRNVLGEPVVRPLPKYNPLGIGHNDTREVDPVMEQITKMALFNQSVADNPSRTIDGPNNIDLTTIPYSDTQSLYDRWVELTGEVKIGGKTLREELAAEFQRPRYLKAAEGRLGSTGRTKGALIRRIIVAYREKAKSELPELMELIKAEKRGDAELLRSQIRSNRELFPLTQRPTTGIARRTFEDLLNN